MAEVKKSAARENFSAIFIGSGQPTANLVENAVGWHGKAAKPAELEVALAELETARRKILEA